MWDCSRLSSLEGISTINHEGWDWNAKKLERCLEMLFLSDRIVWPAMYVKAINEIFEPTGFVPTRPSDWQGRRLSNINHLPWAMFRPPASNWNYERQNRNPVHAWFSMMDGRYDDNIIIDLNPVRLELYHRDLIPTVGRHYIKLHHTQVDNFLNWWRPRLW